MKRPHRRRDASALRVARAVAREWVERGGTGAALVGSHSRGEAHPGSDLDMILLGHRTAHTYAWRDGYLVSKRSKPLRSWRAELRDPAAVGGAVPAWRDALVLEDPRGQIRRIRAEVRRWDWSRLDRRTDRWVAEEITSLAEEAGKLVGLLADGNRSAAALQRFRLAERLPFVLSVHRRWLYGRENLLGDRLALQLRGEWARAYRRAMGLGRATFAEGCRAAGTMYRLAAREVARVLNAEQRAVVEGACRAIERMPRRPSRARPRR